MCVQLIHMTSPPTQTPTHPPRPHRQRRRDSGPGENSHWDKVPKQKKQKKSLLCTVICVKLIDIIINPPPPPPPPPLNRQRRGDPGGRQQLAAAGLEALAVGGGHARRGLRPQPSAGQAGHPEPGADARLRLVPHPPGAGPRLHQRHQAPGRLRPVVHDQVCLKLFACVSSVVWF